jgi:hypothetical protein
MCRPCSFLVAGGVAEMATTDRPLTRRNWTMCPGCAWPQGDQPVPEVVAPPGAHPIGVGQRENRLG